MRAATLETQKVNAQFFGVLGIVTAQQVAPRRLPTIESAGFMEDATSEKSWWVRTGIAHRPLYQFGRDQAAPDANATLALIDTAPGTFAIVTK